MSIKTQWSREQLLVAFNIYCRLPFGKLHSRNPEIIKYAELINRTPSALAMKLTNIASLDPAITSTGRKGLTGASNADKIMWKEMQGDWEGFIKETYEIVNSLVINKFSEDDDEEFSSNIQDEVNLVEPYLGYNKKIESNARIGQSFFRKAVLSAYDFKCCITGLDNSKLLVASHIIPWRADPKNRLNPRNGLCLSVLHDKAFDLGIITISEEFTIKVSKSELINNDFFISTILNYENKKIRLPEKFYPLQEFLAYHRKNIYKS